MIHTDDLAHTDGQALDRHLVEASPMAALGHRSRSRSWGALMAGAARPGHQAWVQALEALDIPDPFAG